MTIQQNKVVEKRYRCLFFQLKDDLFVSFKSRLPDQLKLVAIPLYFHFYEILFI